MTGQQLPRPNMRVLDPLGQIHIGAADFEQLHELMQPDSPCDDAPRTPPSSGAAARDPASSPQKQKFSLLGMGEGQGTSARKAEWRSEEDVIILATFRCVGTQWGRIALQLPGRTADGVRNRWHRLQRRHSLGDSIEGRRNLDELLAACGIDKNWAPPPDPLDPTADGRRSDHTRTMWTSSEDAIICEGVRRHGFKWRQIAASLSGRTDSSVRNRWRRLGKDHAEAFATDGTDSASEREGFEISPGSPSSQASPSPGFGPVFGQQMSAEHDSLSRPRTSDAQAARGMGGAGFGMPMLQRLRQTAPFWSESDLAVSPTVVESMGELLYHLDPGPVSGPYVKHELGSEPANGEDEDEEGGSRSKRFRPTWTSEEDMFIVRYVEEHGRLWSKIAEKMEGRSHRAVRNRWLRMQKGQATRERRGPDNGYRCRRCGELKLGHICTKKTSAARRWNGYPGPAPIPSGLTPYAFGQPPAAAPPQGFAFGAPPIFGQPACFVFPAPQ